MANPQKNELERHAKEREQRSFPKVADVPATQPEPKPVEQPKKTITKLTRDEFVVLLDHCRALAAEKAVVSRTQLAEQCAQKIGRPVTVEHLRDPIRISGLEITHAQRAQKIKKTKETHRALAAAMIQMAEAIDYKDLPDFVRSIRDGHGVPDDWRDQLRLRK